MNNKNRSGTKSFLNLLKLRERHRSETRRLVIRQHMSKDSAPVTIPIHFLRFSLSGH